MENQVHKYRKAMKLNVRDKKPIYADLCLDWQTQTWLKCPQPIGSCDSQETVVMKCGASGIPLPDIVWKYRNTAGTEVQICGQNGRQTGSRNGGQTKGQNGGQTTGQNGEQTRGQNGRQNGLNGKPLSDSAANLTNCRERTRLEEAPGSPVVVGFNEQVIGSKILDFGCNFDLKLPLK